MADDDGTNAWPSYATIAVRCRISERTAMRCVDRLQGIGELSVEHRSGPPIGGKTRQRSNVYSFPAYRVQQGLEKGCQSVRASEGESSDTEGESSDTAVSQDPSFDPPKEKENISRDALDHDQTGELELQEPPAVKAKKSRPTTATTTAPEAFEVTLELRQWFKDEGLGALGVDGKFETEQFLDHHRAKGGKFKRWDLAWKTWMRNAGKYAQQRADRAVPPRGESRVEHRRGEHGEQVFVNGRWHLDRSALPASDWRRFSEQ